MRCALPFLMLALPVAAQVTQPPPAAGTGTTYTPVSPAYVVGNWYSAGWAFGSPAVLVAGRMYFTPLIVTRAITINQLSVNVTTAGATGSFVQASVYPSNSSGYPTSTPVASAQVDVGSAGTKPTGLSSGTGVLTPGLYFLASEADGTAGGTVQLTMTSNNGWPNYVTGAKNSFYVLASFNGGYYASVTYNGTTPPDVTSASFTQSSAQPAIAFMVSALN